MSRPGFIDPRKLATSSSRSSSDPFNKLCPEDINSYASVALQMFQKVLGDVSSKSLFAQTLSNFSKTSSGKYVDPDFSANIKSLAGDNLANRSTWKAFSWLRPEQFMDTSKPIELFQGKIEPTDILQGQLGDCYFLSTLASIAEFPQKIKKVFEFEFPGKNEEEALNMCKQHGMYCVRILDMGVPTEVIMDDFFPCISKSQGPAFTRANQNELWVLLLEKAWAKIYFSYDNIEAGLTRECLHDLTGAPTKTIWTDQKELWENILKGEKSNWIMTAGSNDADTGNEDIADNGIVAGHAYSLIAGVEFNDPQHGNVKLVKLRNPWGQMEWNGKWGDKSPEFDKIPKNYRDEGRKDNDGIFFMSFQDFCVNYESAQFCLCNDDFQYSYLKATLSKKHGGYYQVVISKKGNYFFTVNQRSKRKYPPAFQEEGFEYSQITMVVGKRVGDDKYTYIEGKQKDDREVWTAKSEDAILEEGIYVVYVKGQWLFNNEQQFCLSVYGADKCEITQLQADEMNNFLPKLYLNYAQTISTKKTNLASQGGPNAYLCIDQTDDGYAFAAVWNNEQDKSVKCEIRFKNLHEMQMRLKGKFHNDTCASFVVEPGCDEVCVVRIKDYKKAKLGFSQAISIQPAGKK